jgi:hypothetical protein
VHLPHREYTYVAIYAQEKIDLGCCESTTKRLKTFARRQLPVISESESRSLQVVCSDAKRPTREPDAVADVEDQFGDGLGWLGFAMVIALRLLAAAAARSLPG